jgi:predicted  nucleic acid-binding Zn-ribbon protein
MKRLVLLVCFLLFVSVFAQETYNIYLNDGKIVKSDTKPDIKGDKVYFERFGMLLYLDVNLVDIKTTESGGAITPAQGKEIKKKKVIKISEEELEKIRQRSRLANEDELQNEIEPEGSTESMQGGGQSSSQGGGMRDLQNRLSQLMNQRSALQSNITNLMQELSSKNDQYGFATMAADKERLQKEIDDVQRRLNEARSNLSAVDNQITATQQEIASTPIVLETPPPPPPSRTAETNSNQASESQETNAQ